MSPTTSPELLTPSPTLLDASLDSLHLTFSLLSLDAMPTPPVLAPPVVPPFDDQFPARDPAIDFEVLRIRDLDHRNFPGSLSIVSWNCRGISRKYHSIHDIFRLTGADILVLNETFRLPGTPWPSSLPPCLAEATNSSSSLTRLANGVAVLANPSSLGIGGSIRSYSILSVDNDHGLKVTLKINNLILMAVYAPSSAGIVLLTDLLREATDLSSNLSPVVLCGDLNVTPIDAPPNAPTRVRHFYRLLGGNFFRADTGPIPSRPANRLDAVNQVGNTLDHFFGAHVTFDLSMCLHSLVHASDHHPILTRVTPVRPPTDSSVRYWRLNVEKLSQPFYRDAYIQAVESAITVLRSNISASLPVHMDRSSSSATRQLSVNAMEFTFVRTITDIASRILGRQPVKTLASRAPIAQSAEYRSIRRALGIIYSNLLRYSGTTGTHPRVQEWIRDRDNLRSRLKTLDALDHLHAYRDWVTSFCGLSVSQRLKIMNRTMRRRSAAGACLSSTPDALDSYRVHFAQQFVNNFGIEPFSATLSLSDHLTDLAISTSIFPTALVREKILASPVGKAAGITGLRAELLHPIVDLVAPLLGSMFCVYMTLSFVPHSWKRALICPVPKKGDLSRIANYRPISLLEVTRKIFELCILHQLQADVHLSREQGGFRPGRSTVDQVACLDRLIQHSKSLGRPSHMAFLDIKAAYDSVPRGELWRRCEQVGINYLVLDTLRALFDHNSAQLVVSQHRSSPFSLTAGVLQGSVLSPILYSIFLDPLVESLKHGPSIRLPFQAEGINCLLYADDIALIANTPRELQRLLQLAQLDSLARGYRFSPTKCVVVSPGHHRHHLYGATLERELFFSYLGFVVRVRCIDYKAHITARVKKAQSYAERLRAGEISRRL